MGNVIAYYLGEYTVTFPNSDGEISYTTVALLPSNASRKRVFQLNMSGALYPRSLRLSSSYEIVLQFTNTEDYPIDLQGPVQGQINIGNCHSFNASRHVTYDASALRSDGVLKLFIKNPCVNRNTLFYLAIMVNDGALPSATICPHETNGVAVTSVVLQQSAECLSGYTAKPLTITYNDTDYSQNVCMPPPSENTLNIPFSSFGNDLPTGYVVICPDNSTEPYALTFTTNESESVDCSNCNQVGKP